MKTATAHQDGEIEPPVEMVLLAFYTARAKQKRGGGSIQHENAERAYREYCRRKSRTDASAEMTMRMRLTADQRSLAHLQAENDGTPIKDVIAAIKSHRKPVESKRSTSTTEEKDIQPALL